MFYFIPGIFFVSHKFVLWVSRRVDLHTQDGSTGRNSTEAEALIHAAQTIFGLGGALPNPAWLPGDSCLRRRMLFFFDLM